MKAYLPYLLLPLAVFIAPWAAQWLDSTPALRTPLGADAQSVSVLRGAEPVEEKHSTPMIKMSVFSGNGRK